MRPPPRARGPRNDNFNALSPPIDSSATTETPQQRMRRLQDEALTARVEAFSTNQRICGRVPIFFTTLNEARPVQDVAKDLVGQFLICKNSSVVMRIVETEAYQAGEEIYQHRFREPPQNLRGPAGSLVSCRIEFGRQVLFITAGDGDLVLLRTCSIVLGRDEIESRVNPNPPTRRKLLDMMAGPTKVFVALTPNYTRFHYLLTPSRGLHLRQKEPNPLIMFDGPRVLPKDTPSSSYSKMTGADSRFRFACDCAQKLKMVSTLCRIDN